MRSIAAFFVLTALAGTAAMARPAFTDSAVFMDSSSAAPGANQMTVIDTFSDLVAAPVSVPAATPRLYTTNGTNPAPDIAIGQADPELNAGNAFSGLALTNTALEAPGIATASQIELAPAVVPEPATVTLLALGLLGWAFVPRTRIRATRPQG